MNVYDFDNTIYDGDSSINFIIFCYKNYFCYMYKYIFKHFYLFVCILLSSHDRRTEYKSKFFSFLVEIKDIDNCIDRFSNKEKYKIKMWYLENKKDTDLIITASPEFIVKPICEKIGIKYVIGTKMDKNNGQIKGLNCKGIEKKNRFILEYKDCEINNFYSDSKTDKCMFDMANNSFLVKKNQIIKIK